MLEKMMQKWCQNDAKMEPKWEPKSIKNRKNTGKKVNQKKHEFWQCPGGIPLTPRAPQTHTIQQDNLQINYTEQQKEDNLQHITYRRSSKGNVHDRLCARLECTAVSNPNTPRAPSGPVRISVAYGNIPAPGRRKEKNPKWRVSSDRVWVPRGSGCCERKVFQYQINKQKKILETWRRRGAKGSNK